MKYKHAEVQYNARYNRQHSGYDHQQGLPCMTYYVLTNHQSTTTLLSPPITARFIQSRTDVGPIRHITQPGDPSQAQRQSRLQVGLSMEGRCAVASLDYEGKIPYDLTWSECSIRTYLVLARMESLIKNNCAITQRIFKCTPNARRKSQRRRTSARGGVHAQSVKTAIHTNYVSARNRNKDT